MISFYWAEQNEFQHDPVICRRNAHGCFATRNASGIRSYLFFTQKQIMIWEKNSTRIHSKRQAYAYPAVLHPTSKAKNYPLLAAAHNSLTVALTFSSCVFSPCMPYLSPTKATNLATSLLHHSRDRILQKFLRVHVIIVSL